MKPAPRRMTFQLVSLFDLLMIVIFAQYMDVRETARLQSEHASREVAAAQEKAAQADRKRQEESASLNRGLEIQKLLSLELERVRADREALRVESTRKLTQLEHDLKDARDDVHRVGDLVSELFNLPDELRQQLVKPRSSADAARVSEALQTLAEKRGSDMVRHVLSLDEVQKRCDVWELQIDDFNVTTFTAGAVKVRFRADTPTQFASELFKHYKGLPQPKSMVIMLLSWSDAELRARNAAVEGLEKAAERMRADSERRTRFEYGVLGYIPSQRS